MAAPGGPKKRSSGGRPARDGGPEEAASFIADRVATFLNAASCGGNSQLSCASWRWQLSNENSVPARLR
jgi:hypothetical protein